MANIKFSAFTQKVVQTNVDFLVGYTGADNVRITPAALGDGIYLPLGGGTMVGNIHFNDGINANFGGTAGAWELEIYTNVANDAYIKKTTTSAGDLTIQNASTDGDIIFSSDDGSGGEATYFYLDGSAANPGNYLITLFPDNSRLVLGDGWDIQMWHDGVDGKFYNATGDWKFEQAANDKDIIFYCDDGAGGTTPYLFLDGGNEAVRFSKDSWHNDNVKALFGTGTDLQIYHDGTDSYINNNTGILNITNNDIRFKTTGAETMLRAVANGAVELMYDNSTKFGTTSTGIEVTDEVSIGTSLVHTGDTDTKVSFGTNNITLIAGGATYLDCASDQTTSIYSGNAQTLFCDTSQRVGIGTVTPSYKLQVDNRAAATTGTANPQAFFTGGSLISGDYRDGQIVVGNSVSVGGTLWWDNATAGVYLENTWDNAIGFIAFRTKTSGTPVEGMRITGGGDVGIGTAVPTAKLQVVGLVEYADNAAAIAASLTVGAFYRTGDLLKVVH